jgi:hypothetical protein
VDPLSLRRHVIGFLEPLGDAGGAAMTVTQVAGENIWVISNRVYCSMGGCGCFPVAYR